MSEELSFSHVNLNTVDPNAQSIPEDVYTFEVNDASIKTYKVDKADPASATAERTELALTIVDHDKLSGRRVWTSLFPGDFSNKKLRKVMDATGIQQTGDITEWFSDLKNERARFKAPYRSYISKKNNEKRFDVQLIEAQPTS